jgi:predicted dehydrogenase
MIPESHPAATPAMPRRDFLKTSAGLAVGAALASGSSLSAAQRKRTIGANDRIRIGIIGCGDRGVNAHMEGVYKHVQAMNLEIVALADPWRLARERANAKVKEWFGRDARQCVSYRELLTWDNIDAVMIASPDHLHTTHMEAAARAGKHIYVEKPLGTEMDKLVRAVDAVKAAGVVVQIGTQVRSLPGIVGARDLFKTGVFGKLSRIEEFRNSEKPYWYRYLKDVKQEDVDWKEFLLDRPMRPFRADLYSGWYGHYEFSRGPSNNLGAHFIDLVHYITGAQFPASCVCVGGIFTWKDEHNFTNPDCVQATWIYPEGFLVSSSNNLGNGFGNGKKFYGSKGVLKLDNWAAPTYSAEGGPQRDGSIRGVNPVKLVERPDHFLDWLQCIRSGGTPNAPIEAGYQHAVAVLMADESYKTGRKVVYDPQKRVIRSA